MNAGAKTFFNIPYFKGKVKRVTVIPHGKRAKIWQCELYYYWKKFPISFIFVEKTFVFIYDKSASLNGVIVVTL
jgi:hypothetical protein